MSIHDILIHRAGSGRVPGSTPLGRGRYSISKRWSVRNRVPRVARLDSLYCIRNWPSARLDSLYPQGIANFRFAAWCVVAAGASKTFQIGRQKLRTARDTAATKKWHAAGPGRGVELVRAKVAAAGATCMGSVPWSGAAIWVRAESARSLQ